MASWDLWMHRQSRRDALQYMSTLLVHNQTQLVIHLFLSVLFSKLIHVVLDHVNAHTVRVVLSFLFRWQDGSF